MLQKTRSETEVFLATVRKLLEEDEKNLVIVPRTDNKTVLFMNEHGFRVKHVIEILQVLSPDNFCKAEMDDNPDLGGEVWIFGYHINRLFAEMCCELYIKLKLTEKVICISFHEAEGGMVYAAFRQG